MKVFIVSKNEIRTVRVSRRKPTFSYDNRRYEMPDARSKLRHRPILPATKTFIYWEGHPKPIDTLDPKVVARLQVPQIAWDRQHNPPRPYIKYIDGLTLDGILDSSGIIRYLGERPLKLNLKLILWAVVGIAGLGAALHFLGLI